MLHILLDQSAWSESGTRAVENYLLCPNCDSPFTSPATPYCSEICKSQAAFVRQMRSAIVSEAVLNPEKQTAFGERLWWILGGGLPMRDGRIPESAKRQVIKRCSGNCEFCGKPMTAIQNFGSGCNRPLHLRAVCDGCSKTKAFGDPDFIQNPEVRSTVALLAARVFSKSHLRICDDSDNWNWREFVAGRRS